MTIKVLRDKKAALLKEANDLQAKDAAGTITEAELTRLNAITDDELPKVNASIARTEKLMDEQRTMPAAAFEQEERPAAGSSARVQVPTFKNLGEQLAAIAGAEMSGTQPQNYSDALKAIYKPNVFNAAASGANESVPSQGGFLVGTDTAAPMIDSMFEGGDILSRVRKASISSSSNGLDISMLDETSRADGSRSGGIAAYWTKEAGEYTSSTTKFRNMELRLKKLTGLSYVTEEQAMDSTFLQSWYGQAFNDEFTFKIEDAIINGNGEDRPLGILNSGALVQTAKESGQAADTVVAANVRKMFSRLPARARRNAVWLINQELEQQLWALNAGTGTSGYLLYAPPGVTNPNAGPAGSMLGRPVLPIEQAAAPGDLGDILLVDLSQYLAIDKAAIRADSSIHVRFNYGEMTFRWMYRIDGQPLIRTPLAPFKGSLTRSPYVALAAR